MILQSLVDFDRRQRATPGEAPAADGYTKEKVSFALVIDAEGQLLDAIDLRLRDESSKRLVATVLDVPQPVKRTSGVAANTFWDKASYVLGLTAPDSKASAADMAKRAKRTAAEHATFIQLHRDLLEGSDDPALAALCRFLDAWVPNADHPVIAGNSDLLEGNLVFKLDGVPTWLHERPAAQALLAGRGRDAEDDLCLVSGEKGPTARLHPSIKGVWGAQSSGASIVSFNIDAFESYGKKQGANAPVSQAAADAYGRALNELLAKGSRRRVQIADTSTVFWAERDAPAEDAFMGMLFEDSSDEPEGGQLDPNETAKLRAVVGQLGKGRGIKETDPGIDPEVRYHVLGLAPNAARISIRFWHTDTLGGLAERFRQHWLDLRLEPSRFQRPPALWRLLRETAVEKKMENVPKQLAGEVTRAILTGGRYPRSLLANVIMRIRADGEIDELRASMIKAVLVRAGRIERNEQEDTYVSLDTENTDPAYRLGRLFAVLEKIQQRALGMDINSTIRDKYYASASATPASIFPLLISHSGNHLSVLRKSEGKRGLARYFDREIGLILHALPPNFPRSFPIDAQGRFAIGYYHQKATRSTKSDSPAENHNDDHEEN